MGQTDPSFWLTDMWSAVATPIRQLVIAGLIGGAATVMVAPALDMASQRSVALQQPRPTATPATSDDAPALDFDTLLLACLETANPESDACGYAQIASGHTRADFRAAILSRLFPAARTTPSAAPTEPAQAPVVAVAATPKPTAKPTQKATPKPAATLSFDTLLAKCLDTRDINSDWCVRAEEASGLSSADFGAKFNAKLAAKDGNDFWAWFDKCLATRDITTDACVRAQELIGFSDADFQAKFDRYLAERDAAAKKATPAPKPAVGYTFDTLFRMCGESRDRKSGACEAALVVSHLTPAEFWAKVAAKFGF